VDAETGEEQWRFTEPSDGVYSSPTVVDGTVYVGSQDGNLYAVDAGVSGSSEGSRVMLGTLGHHGNWRYAGQSIETKQDGGNETGSEDSTSESLPDGLASYMVTAAAVVGVVAVGYGGIRAIVSGGSNEYASKSSESEEGVTTNDSLGGTGDRSETTKTNSPQPPRKQATPTEIDVGYDDLTSKEKVGAGGSADVYRATCNGRTIAVKEPRMSGTLHKSTAKRFIEEAKTWDKLDDHENIVSVLDYGSEPLPWIAMEYMGGGDLSQRDQMSIEEKMRFSVAITNGIRHAHRQGVAHLDLKPENILFRETRDGYYDVPKVTDWGLAKMLLKHSKSIEGMSPQYSAPEQFDEDEYGRPDDKTDIYQLGAVFYEMYTGGPPFEGHASEVMHSVLNKKVTPPTEANPDLPSEIDNILLKALEKEKKDRYEDVVYLRDALRELY
jgi:tRNA A-37 threonylcarbamoyl transferase component Bud32